MKKCSDNGSNNNDSNNINNDNDGNVNMSEEEEAVAARPGLDTGALRTIRVSMQFL